MNVVSALGALAASALGAAGGSAHFALQAGRFVSGELVVVRFEGAERLNQPFTYEITIESTVPPAQATSGIHGFPARLSVQSADQGPRRIEGIVSACATIGADTRNAQKYYHYRVSVVPRLWLLTRVRNHRVFQDQSALDIAQAVLADMGIVPIVRVSAPDSYGPIAFVCQRGETDLEFLNRVLALAGLTYFFVHPQGSQSDFPSRFASTAGSTSGSSDDAALMVSESMVIADSLDGMSQIGVPETLSDGNSASSDTATSGGAPASSIGDSSENGLPFAADGQSGSASEGVTLFESRTELAPTAVAIRDWVSAAHLSLDQALATDTATDDPNRARADTGLGTVEFQRDGAMLGTFNARDTESSSIRALAQVRAESSRAVGKSDCRRLAPGYRFTLSGHPVDELNIEFLVTAVRSHGTNPEKLLDANTPVYENDFECAPAALPPCPPKPDARSWGGGEEARVIGDAHGVPQCDDQGRIKVRFHWANLGERSAAGASGECWVRWVERWAGEGYGTMTVPRVGSEVWVEFPRHEGAEPVATGQLYSSQNIPPFSFGDQQHKVGIRSSTLPRGGASSGGFNELSMSDAPDAELLYLRAQRNMTVHALHDQAETIGNDRRVVVGRNDTIRVEKDARESVTESKFSDIGGDLSITIGGNRREMISGSVERLVVGHLTDNVTGGEVRTVVGTHAATFENDFVERHVGHKTIVVGDATHERAHTLSVTGSVNTTATDDITFVSATKVTVQCGTTVFVIDNGTITGACGTSTFAMTKDTIKLDASTVEIDASTLKMTAQSAATLGSPKTTLAGQSANIVLDSNVTAQGSAIKLGNGGSTASSEDESAKPAAVTTIVLTDEDGEPLANARVVLRRGGEGGPERSVVLDDRGSTVIEGDDDYSVMFPDRPLASSQ